MRKKIYLGVVLLQAIIFTSCVNQKQIAYFQKNANQPDTIQEATAYIPKIQPGDILSISIGSLNPIASSFFNPFSTMPITSDNANSTGTSAPGSGGGGGGGSASSLTQSAAPGFLVNVDGSIDMPILGAIKLTGLTTIAARDTIKNHLKFYLKDPTVSVRLLNYKISVMGEVAKPSIYVIPNEKVTLPEALSLAGDLTIFGRRDNVLVIRDDNGKKVFGRVNLNTRDVYNSPYYYLHANDIVYVEPGKGRVAQTDKIYQLLPVLLSALSLITIIFEYTRR